MPARSVAVVLPVALGVSLGQAGDRGRKPVQQDFHGARIPVQPVLGNKGIVLALADGIGTSKVSQEASQAAVRSALEDYYCTSETWGVKRSMQRVLAATNSWLHAQTQRSPYRHDHDRGYVCAMSVLVLKGRSAHLFHAGDTRIYRLQGRALEQLTEDHRVWIGGGRSYLSRALGFHAQLELDYQLLPLERGDVFVLASDGVYEHVQAAQVADALRVHAEDLDAAARAIVALALAQHSEDNLTVQLLRVDTLPDHEIDEMQRQRAGLPLPPLLRAREVFDGYRIERELHTSHRSRIYLATDLESGGSVVLKVPSTEAAQDEAQLDRFMLEEWVARRLHSAHVLAAHRCQRRRSHLYVAMEYLHGRTLAQWIRDHPEPELQAVRDIIEQVARALQALHRMEMVHRDLRPENVMIDANGTVKIIDFGSVRVAGLTDVTPAALLGTFSHTAPEVFLGEDGSERSDQFSLGVLAYQLLTGGLPYGTCVPRVRRPADLKGLVYASAYDGRRRIPAWVDGAIARAVHPLAHKRYDALSEFVHDLREPNPVYLAARREPWVQRHPVRFWKGVSALLAGLVIALIGVLHSAGFDKAVVRPPTPITQMIEKRST